MKLLSLLIISVLPLAGCSVSNDKKPANDERMSSIVGVSDKPLDEVKSCVLKELNNQDKFTYSDGEKLGKNQTVYNLNFSEEKNMTYRLAVSDYDGRRIVSLYHKKKVSSHVRNLDAKFLDCVDKPGV